ncbi:hypothetical protein CYLTODRAFT_459044 [Cylindrobasidium torrendii FP15055 ss-10]|uniref:Uncharacterized protein n=1 Tax=Cylindrobasidium torrendii FP15055 ss-10 TaxID=1314674 RepID=A0A0D7AWY3_9AGAR|nr:hypothetical protein CYLTODRAFT_459044 [Cylindrobasidium torrendii FP15055 ss-10]
MPALSELEMVAASKARAEALDLPLYPDVEAAYFRRRLSGGIAIPYDEVIDWDKRLFLERSTDLGHSAQPFRDPRETL